MADLVDVSVVGVVNGQSYTLGAISFPNDPTKGLAASSIAFALPYPIEIDVGTNISLVVAGTAEQVRGSATVHLIEEDYL